ncbi:hypothetical protein J2W96_005949 [Variovorax guangxiensis]|nr:hypothetical protein [Variovorax guangxiensis]
MATVIINSIKVKPRDGSGLPQPRACELARVMPGGGWYGN